MRRALVVAAVAVTLPVLPARAATETAVVMAIDYAVTCVDTAPRTCDAVLTTVACTEWQSHSNLQCTVDPVTFPLVGLPATNLCLALVPDATRPTPPLVVHTRTAGDLVVDATLVMHANVSELAGVVRPGGPVAGTLSLVGLKTGAIVQSCPEGSGRLQGALTLVAP